MKFIKEGSETMKNDWSMVENSQKSLQKKIRYVKQIKEFLDNSDNYKEGEAPDFRTGKMRPQILELVKS